MKKLLLILSAALALAAIFTMLCERTAGMLGNLMGAEEQENRAEVQGMRAKVIEAEAEVPRAIASAFREGKLGVMDYYNMQNIISDTKMRESIAGGAATPAKRE